jgi:hypothetical protein
MALGLFLYLGHNADHCHFHANLVQKKKVTVNKSALSDKH